MQLSYSRVVGLYQPSRCAVIIQSCGMYAGQMCSECDHAVMCGSFNHCYMRGGLIGAFRSFVLSLL